MIDTTTTDRLGTFTADIDILVDRLAALPTRPTLDELSTAMAYVGRLHAADLLLAVEARVGADVVSPLVHVASTAGETPSADLEDLMHLIGHREDGTPATPPAEIILYRAATVDTARGACWTADVRQAREHARYAARRDGVAPTAMRIYRAVVPGEHLLARITDRSEDEYPVAADYRASMEIEEVERVEAV